MVYQVLFALSYITCSGHRIGTAEVESALVSHPQCAEAAVVGVEHEVVLYIMLMSLVYIINCPLFSTLRPSLQGSASTIFILNGDVRLKDKAYMHLLLWLKAFLTVMISGKVLL